uniref:BBM1 n=1 Tax=Rosa canina TaxID=74635 RepID=X2CT83_ROSCN|nr:BBM1 [Rosa canina]
MNMNWLGFSLSPQEDDHAPISHQLADQETLASRLGFNSNEIQGAGGGTDVSGGGSSECFDVTNSDSTASVNHHLTPSIFGIHEAAAFNRNNDHIHSQDWNMKGAGMNSSDSNNYKRTSSSDLSTMLMGSNTSTTSTSYSIISQQANLENHHQQLPKLENFLGRHSFADHDSSSAGHDYMFDMNNGPGPVSSNVMNTKTNSNNIGLSMIKTWLRNQPSQPRDNHHQLEQESKNSKESRNQPQSSLSLSMGTGSLQTVTTATAGGAATGETTSSSDKNTKQSPVVTATTTTGTDAQTQSTGGAIEAVPRKAIDTFGQRTSIYRGVTRHRWTGRYEAHLWDNSCRREGQTRKGRQVYLGGYDKEDKAARAYDLAALKYWGTTTTTNFPISSYEKEIDEMKPMTRQEYVASLRRKSSGFSRGASIYRGVTRHHQHGRWQARIGRVAGNKDLYLGTFSTQEEAAEAYDIAAIKFRGLNAVTNFDMSRYDVKSILESSALPITTGATAKRLKDVQQQQPPPPADHHHQIMLSSVLDHHGQVIRSSSSTEHDIMSNVYSAYGSYGAQQGCSWPTLAFNQAQAQAAAAPHQAPFAAGINGMQLHYSPYGYGYGNAHAQRVWCKQEQDTNSNQERSFHHQDDDHLRQQLQLGGTHNFFHDHDQQQQQQQQQTSGLMGLMDSSAASMEHSSGSNSVIYSGGDHHGNNNGYGSSTTGTGGGYIMPMVMSTVVANDDQNQADGNNNNINGFGDGDDQEANIKAQQLGYDHHPQNMFLGSSSTIDPAYQHHASNRNLYYHLPVQDDQHESSSVAVATSSTTCNMNWVPTAVPTLAHPTFTVWNDT